MLRVLIVWYGLPRHLIKMSEADNNKCEGFGSPDDHPETAWKQASTEARGHVSLSAPSSCGLSRLASHVPASEVSMAVVRRTKILPEGRSEFKS